MNKNWKRKVIQRAGTIYQLFGPTLLAIRNLPETWDCPQEEVL